MLNKLKKTGAMFIISAFMFCINVNATEDVLKPYKDELEKINGELGINYKLPSEEELVEIGMSKESMEQFYLNMTIPEFREYIVDLFDKDSMGKVTEYAVEKESGIDLCAFTLQQNWFYKANSSNYLYIKSNVNYADGSNHYVSLYSIGAEIYDFPGYMVLDGRSTVSYSGDKKTANVTFKCTKYLSKYVTDGVLYILPVTFNANGGNI